MKHFLPLILGLFVFSAVQAVAEGDSLPVDRFPSAVGYSLSNLTGIGFTYRVLNSNEGFQVSAVLASNTLFDPDHRSLYSFGGARYWVLYSFAVPPAFYSQLYWLAGGAWKSASTRTYVNYSQEKITWAQTTTVGPGLGIELGLVDHFSLNFEADYEVRYNFGEVPAGQDAMSFAPGASITTLVRF